jgi:hypothetical protein
MRRLVALALLAPALAAWPALAQSPIEHLTKITRGAIVGKPLDPRGSAARFLGDVVREADPPHPRAWSEGVGGNLVDWLGQEAMARWRWRPRPYSGAPSG